MICTDFGEEHVAFLAHEAKGAVKHVPDNNAMGFNQCILPRSPTHVLRGMRLSQVPQSLSVASHGLSQQGVRGLMLLLPLRTH